MIDLKLYMEFMDQVGARYGVPPDDILIVPDLDVSGRTTADGKMLFKEYLDPEKVLPIFRIDHIVRVLLSSPEKIIEFLMLHEIYHLENHHRNINELTEDEWLSNEFAADDWALKEMGLL